ncbi:MAG: polyamine ABC transporter substrate-binding protein, partial [Methylobacteriaceae bacterium]|nr:polyamine ABC transporter substrate-binding protein [Methylobacteriaceae bacterium]
DLAESWEKNADGTVWTFKLRKGVKFHRDYGEMTSEDVVFSIRRAADPKSSSFSGDYGALASVEAVDPYTVRITLKNPVPSLLGLVANYHGGNIVSKKAVEKLGEDFRLKPVGTGPFMVDEYKPKESVAFLAHSDYFRGKPKIDKIVYRFIPADAARDLAFESGEIDVIYGRQDQKWVERFKAKSDVIVDVVRPTELAMLHINMSQKPLDNPKVREAIGYALDAGQVAAFMGNLVAVPGRSVVPIGYLGFDDSTKIPCCDPNKAKQLLAEAGFGQGLTIKAVQTNLPSMLSVMQVVQAQMKKAGIDLQLDVVDHQTFHANIRKNLSQVNYYAAARFPIADVYLSQFFHSRAIVGTPTAVTNFSHCKVADAEIDAARVEQDPAKQKQLWASAQKKIIEERCAFPIHEQLQSWARKANVDYGYKFEASMHLGPTINESTDKK